MIISYLLIRWGLQCYKNIAASQLFKHRKAMSLLKNKKGEEKL